MGAATEMHGTGRTGGETPVAVLQRIARRGFNRREPGLEPPRGHSSNAYTALCNDVLALVAGDSVRPMGELRAALEKIRLDAFLESPEFLGVVKDACRLKASGRDEARHHQLASLLVIFGLRPDEIYR